MFILRGKRRVIDINVVLDDIGGAGLYLLSDLSGAVTGEIHYVDCGFKTIGMPPPKEDGNPQK